MTPGYNKFAGLVEDVKHNKWRSYLRVEGVLHRIRDPYLDSISFKEVTNPLTTRSWLSRVPMSTRNMPFPFGQTLEEVCPESFAWGVLGQSSCHVFLRVLRGADCIGRTG